MGTGVGWDEYRDRGGGGMSTGMGVEVGVG